MGTQRRWVPLGDSLAIIKQHKASFTVVRFPNPLATGSDIHGNWGTWLVFRGLSEFHPTFLLYIPPSLYIPNLKSKTVFCYNLNSDLKACQAGGVCMNQSTMCVTTYIFAFNKVNSLTHSLARPGRILWWLKLNLGGLISYYPNLPPQGQWRSSLSDT